MPCHAMPCHAMPCHAMPCHAMPCHAMPCHAMPYHTKPYHTIQNHTMPCHAMPCHAIPYHTMPYHAIPCHTIPYHTIAQVQTNQQYNISCGKGSSIIVNIYASVESTLGGEGRGEGSETTVGFCFFKSTFNGDRQNCTEKCHHFIVRFCGGRGGLEKEYSLYACINVDVQARTTHSSQ